MKPDEIPPDDPLRGLLYAGLGVLCFAPGAVFVRLAEGVSPLEICCFRMAMAATIMGLAGLATASPMRPPRGSFSALALIAGVTAFHFWSFTAGLERSSIAHGLALCYTAPVFAALLGRAFLGERLRPGQWLGILLVVAAVGVLATKHPSGGRATLEGDLLALASGAALGIYHVAGRGLRHRLPLFAYTFWVYGGAALFLACLAWPFPSSYGSRAIGGILGLGLFGSTLGHTLVNAALRKTRAAYVSLITTQEVTGGIVMGALVLGEWPDASSLPALAVLLVGLVAVLWRPGRKSLPSLDGRQGRGTLPSTGGSC